MATVDFSAGYRDATKGATLKALQKRRDDQAAALALSMKPREIGSAYQGAAQIADVISGSIREGRIANQEASGRKRFAELLAGGLAPDEIGEAMGLDPETAMKYQERTWAEETDLKKHGWDVDAAAARVKAEQAAQQAGFTHTDTSREDTQTEARTAAEEAAREAEKKSTLDAALSTKEGELNAAVTSGVMTPEQAAQHLDEYKRQAEADIAAKTPDQIVPMTPELAAKWGIDEKDRGKYKISSKTGEPELITPFNAGTAAQEKSTWEDRSTLNTLDSGLNELTRALELVPNVVEGGSFGQKIAQGVSMTPDIIKSEFPDLLPGDADATARFYQIMNSAAVTRMAEQMKGSTSYQELQHYIGILSDPDTSPKVKGETISAFINLLRSERNLMREKMTTRGADPGDYTYRNPDVLPPENQPAAPAPTAASPAGEPAPAPAAAPAERSDEDILKQYRKKQ